MAQARRPPDDHGHVAQIGRPATSLPGSPMRRLGLRPPGEVSARRFRRGAHKGASPHGEPRFGNVARGVFWLFVPNSNLDQGARRSDALQGRHLPRLTRMTRRLGAALPAVPFRRPARAPGSWAPSPPGRPAPPRRLQFAVPLAIRRSFRFECPACPAARPAEADFRGQAKCRSSRPRAAPRSASPSPAHRRDGSGCGPRAGYPPGASGAARTRARRPPPGSLASAAWRAAFFRFSFRILTWIKVRGVAVRYKGATYLALPG